MKWHAARADRAAPLLSKNTEDRVVGNVVTAFWRWPCKNVWLPNSIVGHKFRLKAPMRYQIFQVQVQESESCGTKMAPAAFSQKHSQVRLHIFTDSL
jgi:hypothetical protein